MTPPYFRGNSRLVQWLNRAFLAYQPFRFLIVGGFNTGLCFLVYVLLVQAGLVVWVANTGALLFGIGLSFLTQGRVTFRNSDPRRFWRFALSWVIISSIQTTIIEVLVHKGMGPTLAGLIVLPGAALTAYFVQKWFVFHKPGSTT